MKVIASPCFHDTINLYGEAYFSLAYELSDMIWTADLDLRLTYLNKAVSSLFGYGISEVIYKKLIDFCEPDSAELLSRRLDEEIRKEKSRGIGKSRFLTIELKHACADGSVLWTETRIGFLRNLVGDVVGFIGVSRDITDRRRQQNVLLQGKLLSIIGEMTSVIASEINNAVGGILLSSEQLMMGKLSSQAKKDLSAIHDEAQRVARMMTNLLNSCNLAPENIERYKLNRILNKVLEIRRYGHVRNNIDVSTDLHKPTIYVMCDTHQLQQVFTRLLQDAETALLAQNGGNIVITSRRQGDWARVSIADNRLIRVEKLPEQIPGNAFITSRPTGDITRLDMILCHAIITAHSGQLYSESNRMGGNTFIIELPIHKPPRPEK